MNPYHFTQAGNWQPKRDFAANKGAWASIFAITSFVGYIVYVNLAG